MAEERKYTIVVMKDRVEVSREVYYAYHRAREAERYQMQIVHQTEMSLERFQKEGVNVECRFGYQQLGLDEVLIRAEDILQLYRGLDMLKTEERLLIKELYFKGNTETEYAREHGITQQAVSKRKQKVLKRLRFLLN